MTPTKILVRICLYCLNCTKFVQLFFRKIIKIVATRCQILRLKCNKFDFGWGSTPDPARGAYSAPQTPQLDLRGLLLRRGRGREEEMREKEGRENAEMEGKERGGEEKGLREEKGREERRREGRRRDFPLSEILNTPLVLILEI